MGRTVYLMAAFGGRLEILQKLWECTNENLTTEEVHNKLLLATDRWGRTFFHMATNRNSSNITEHMDGSKQTQTTEEIYNKTLSETESNK
jgi:hypothetical protein